MLPCSSGCAPDRACSDPGGDGACLVDCNGSSLACPPNTFWTPRADGYRICAPRGIGCRALENVRRCSTQLCQSRALDVTCPNNLSYCPANSTCSSDSRTCTCEAGLEAIDCNDQPCNNMCGGERTWWCAPNISIASCAMDFDGVAATCECWSGTIAIECDREGVTCDDLCRQL